MWYVGDFGQKVLWIWDRKQRESKEKKLAWECEQGQGDFDWSTLTLIRALKQIPG